MRRHPCRHQLPIPCTAQVFVDSVRGCRLLWPGACGAAGRHQLADDLLKKVKHGTVHLKVKQANGNTSEGSGWFVDRGMIITNAHVLNMHGGDKRQPSKIEVTIDSGESTSRTVIAKFRGAAYEADLMLLKVDRDLEGLPDPLTLNSDAPLSETQNVYVFGFPLGNTLGKNITVSKSSISSLRSGIACSKRSN